MKALASLLPSLFVWFVFSSLAVGEIVTVTLQKSSGVTIEPVTITVPAGKVFETVSFSHTYSNAALKKDGMAISYSLYLYPNDNLNPTAERWKATVAGPATLTLAMTDQSSLPSGHGCLLTYKLTDNVMDTGVVSPSSGSAVVIPADAAGPVQIILESSIDLVTWTAANPGSYGASTQKRFFRVRAVNQ